MAAAHHLSTVVRKETEGRVRLGVSAFADALLGIPKVLAENSGYQAQVRILRQTFLSHLLFLLLPSRPVTLGLRMLLAGIQNVWAHPPPHFVVQLGNAPMKSRCCICPLAYPMTMIPVSPPLSVCLSSLSLSLSLCLSLCRCVCVCLCVCVRARARARARARVYTFP
jgi:hypothetical protein